MKITKPYLKYIYKLAELCVSKDYFLWNNETEILKKLRPIGNLFFNRKLCSEFGRQSHCRSINLKSGYKNV